MLTTRNGVFLVVSPDFGPTVLEQFASVADLVARLQTLHGSHGTQTFSFEGVYMPVTKPPRHLVTEDGPVSLAPHAEPAEIDEEGFVGTPPPRPALLAPACDITAEEDGDVVINK
jgi:hypothetical protein